MKYVIYGLGISGVAAIKFFAKNGNEIIATDDNPQSLTNVKDRLSTQNIENFSSITFLAPGEIDFDANTTIIFAPGIPLYHPKPHKILDICQKTQAKLICDLEAFYTLNTNHNFIGITGTNGKSTVTSLVGFIFKELGITSEIGGNLGIPCFELKKNLEKTAYIFEMSSYQLDLIDDMHCTIASSLNITPDHIERHGSLNNYIQSKKRIFKNQKEGDFSLINVDNDNSRIIFDELQQHNNFKSSIIAISTQRIYENSVSLIHGIVYNRIADEKSDLTLGDVFLKGEHNSENIATAFAITYCYLKQENLLDKIQQSDIIAAIRKFKGLKHRMQFLGAIGNINFINDSKATNAESAKSALEFYDNIFWILGGKSKENGISSLAPYFKKINKAFLIGQASEDFANILSQHGVAFEKCGTLANAIEKSFTEAKKHSLKEKNILLSPACASFDQWQSFEERGDFFCKAFNDLQHS